MNISAVVFLVIVSSILSAITSVYISCKIIEKILFVNVSKMLDTNLKFTESTCNMLVDKVIELQKEQATDKGRLNQAISALNQLGKFQ
ncbi:MAG: hypothetical protein GX957_05065 [Clostridiaceae bacterium]|nr:hypothetical protein [Clostridiaceae bacterium]